MARNDQRKPLAERPQYRVCEISHELKDIAQESSYPLRWVFSWNSNKAKLDARERQKHIQAGEQALQRVAHLLGKYDYTCRATILARLSKALTQTHASTYYKYALTGSDEKRNWQLNWSLSSDVVDQAERFDGLVLLCTNVPAARLSSDAVMKKYKEQVAVEQTFDFIKSPVQIRPMWLHSPLRIAGLTLLIVLAVLIAGLIEYQVRQKIAHNKKLIKGLMSENRDNPYPTAKKLLEAFQDYTLVLLRYSDGREEILYPKLRPVQQQILHMLAIPSIRPTPP